MSTQADHNDRDGIAESIASDVAIVTEAAYRRRSHQGYEAGAPGDCLAFELIVWRFGTPPDSAPEQFQSRRTILAAERLRLEAALLIEKPRSAPARNLCRG